MKLYNGFWIIGEKNIMKYDKEQIDKLAYKYVETEDKKDFDNLLCALEPMIIKVLFRYQKYREHQEDLKNEIFIKIIKNLEIGRSDRKNKTDLKECFKKNIPSDFFFFRIKRFAQTAISGIDGFFDLQNIKYKRDKVRVRGGYDVYNDNLLFFDDLAKDVKLRIGFDESFGVEE